MSSWKDYQKESATFFCSLGFDTSTDVTLTGVRTRHDVDVFVSLKISGFEVKWIVECKQWTSAVTKLHVFALREIVSDLGADRGILLCESGFQRGANEAASLTNVQVTSLAALKVSSRDAVYAVRLNELYDRVEHCRKQYWDIPKDVRIAKGLRFGFGEPPLYSGARVINFSNELLSRAFRGVFPIRLNEFDSLLQLIPVRFDTYQDVVDMLDPLLAELEAKLASI